MSPTRRDFLKTTGTAAAAAGLGVTTSFAQGPTPAAGPKRRYAIVGTGVRAIGMWGRPLLQRYADNVEFVGLCDINPKRAELAKTALGVSCPTFSDFDKMCDTVKPELLTVTTVDAFHAEYIVRALDRGIDVITEKPMVIDEAQCQKVLDAEARNKRKIIVAFNYRFAPKHTKVKEIIQSGEIGTVTGVDFHWYLDTSHGADYFRRWHRLKDKGGSLWVHKATHHFDLVNWWLDADPVEVQAYGELSHYGKKGPFRSTNCRPCPHKGQCQFYWDIGKMRGGSLYTEAESVDGYLRDGCVFKEDIDIWDTMSASIRYSNNVLMLVLPEHLHADRGLPPGVQRHQGPARGPRLRTSALGSARCRHVRDPQFRQAREGGDPAGRGRSRRRRQPPARPDLPQDRGAEAPPAARLARRRDVVPHGHRGTEERRGEEADQDRPADQAVVGLRGAQARHDASFRPTIPATIIAMQASRSAVAGSPSAAMPTRAVPTVPMPVQTA